MRVPESETVRVPGWRWLTAPSRLAGVDLARGLAVIGMLAAHLLTIDAFDPARSATWVDIANGRSSILFATAAGVSIALVTGGAAPWEAEAMGAARRRLAVRAGAVWVIGVALVLTGVPVYVILPAYAVLFLLVLPLLQLRAAPLWAIATGAALVVPWVQPILDALPVWQGPYGADLALLVGWHYPFPVWFAFVAAGLAAGRSDLGRLRTQLLLLVAGAVCSALGYGAAALLPAPPDADGALRAWTAEAHSGGILEVIGSGGFALALLGAALLVCRTPFAWVAIPLRAVGAMPLTAYTGQIVAWAVAAAWLIGDVGDLAGFRALDPLGPFVLMTLMLCTVWALLWGQGPMERLVAWVARLGAGSPDPSRGSGPARLVR